MNNTTTQTPVITFQSFIDSREAADDISKVIQCDQMEGQKGYVYLKDGKDGYYIQQTAEGMFWTIATNEEIMANTLAEAEYWLWNNFVFDEVCVDLNRIPEFDYDATPESCDKWIEKLHAVGLLYHFDDEPNSIIHDGGIRTFTSNECETLSKIIWEMSYIEGYDPFIKAVEITGDK